MIWRSSVIRAVPAAAISRAPAMAARSSATASDRRRWAPRKLMLTVCAFWMMKIITTMRPRAPAIRAVRMPLILVCIRRRVGADAGGGGAGGAEPLAEGVGSVLVAPGGAGVSVMVLLPDGSGPSNPGGLRAHHGSRGHSAAVSRCLIFSITLKQKTSN